MNKSQTPKPDPAIKPRRLGRGLSSLLGTPVAIEVGEHAVAASTGPRRAPVEEPIAPMLATPVFSGPAPQPPSPDTSNAVVMIPVGEVVANRFQPRREFNVGQLMELAASIKSAGVVQPILVRRNVSGATSGRTGHGGEAGYELIAGERRWRASVMAGLARVPAVVADLSDEQAAEWALIENVQRVDLGAMEQAYAVKQLCEQFGLTHQRAAEKLGVDRATVSNLIRLTELEPEIRTLIERGMQMRGATGSGGDTSDLAAVEGGHLSAGHGKVLLTMPAGPRRVAMAKKAAETGWSVRRLESAIALMLKGGEAIEASRTPKAASAAPAGMRDLERQLSDHLGTKVEIKVRSGGKRGALSIKFYDLDQFDGLMAKMGFVMK